MNRTYFSPQHINSMQTMLKRVDVACLVAIIVFVILAICRESGTFTHAAFSDLRRADIKLDHYVLKAHKADAAIPIKGMDTSISLVTSFSDEIGEVLLHDFLRHKWPHPVIIYTTFKCHQAVEEAVNLLRSQTDETAAYISSRFRLFHNISNAFVNVTTVQPSVELVHDASKINPFQSQTFFWSDFDVMVTLMNDGGGSLHRAHIMLSHHPDAVLYHRSRPLIRHRDVDDGSRLLPPPKHMASQYACKMDACRHLYMRYQKSSEEQLLIIPNAFHTQLCIENPEACVLLHGPDEEYVGNKTSLWRLLSETSHPPAVWNQLAVCTLIRDKNEQLPEWIEFHRIQGFDHFVIYDDASRNPSLFLDSYIEDGIVTVLDWSGFCANLTHPTEPHGFAACQRAAFADCQQRIVSRWLGIFDVDEFIFAPPTTNGTVLSILHEQSEDVAGFHFVGAVFGNGNRTLPEFPINKTDMVLVTERYTMRQPVNHEEAPGDQSGAHFWANKEIARLRCVNRNQHGIHTFFYDACPAAQVVKVDFAETNSALRMHHYQYQSEFQSHLKARLNGNPHVAILDPAENAAYNMIEDTTAAYFSNMIRAALLERDVRGANGVIPRGITLVITSIGRVDLLNRTLESFRRYNTYPIARAIIVEDSGQAGIADFAHEVFDFPVEIIYNPDLGEKRHHKMGMLGLIDCIDLAYSHVQTEFIFHMEDDWEFLAPGFIEQSIDILDADDLLIQVWLRAHNDGHPRLPTLLETPRKQAYFLMNPEFGDWHGFSFNPGLRRLHDYSVLGTTFYEATKPHRQQIAGELDVNLLYYGMGYRAATTQRAEGFIRHIGWGRTTDPGCSQGC